MTKRFRFSRKALDELQTDKPRDWFFDDQVTTLAVMVTSAGAKSFYAVKYRLGTKHQVRIGSVAEVPIDAARRKASEIVLGIMKGEIGQQVNKRITLAAAFEEYISQAKAHRKPRTVTDYVWQWEKHLKAWAGNWTIAELRRKDVQARHLEIGSDSGPHMANRVVALLRAVLNQAIKDNELSLPNPAAGITFFDEQQRSRRLQVEEIPAFFEAVHAEPNTDIRDFVLLALFTGVRKSNLLAMQWQHLSLERGLWIVPAVEAKSNREMPVALSTAAVEILTDRQAHIEGPYVFPGRRGAAHMMDPKIGWQRILDRAGLENLRMHDLRRSLASFQIDTGTPLEVIQKTLGHGSLATTQIYARMAMEPVRESVERAVEEILKKAETTR